MSSNEPKDPNIPTPPADDAGSAASAAETALNEAKATAEAANAARARAEALSKPAISTKSAVDPRAAFDTSHGMARGVLKPENARKGISRLALGVVGASVLVAVGGYLAITSNANANEKLQAAAKGSTCGIEGNQSCLSQLVLEPKFAQERAWREHDNRAKPIKGTIELTYEPADATVEVFQIRYKQTAAEWLSGAKGNGTKFCEGADNAERCEFVYKAIEGVEFGQCQEGTPVEVKSLTGTKNLASLRMTNVPIYETVRSCGGEAPSGEVQEAFNYEYRLVFSHKDFEPKTVYLSRSAWTVGIGSYTLAWPGLKLSPTPAAMLDKFVKFRSELFCYMKKNSLEPDKVPASVVDSLRLDNGFETIELYDKTETLATSPERKAWWDERWKEIEAQTCEN